MALDSIARCLSQPLESEDQRWLRMDLLKVSLLGDDGAVKYFASILTGTDQFNSNREESLRVIRSIVLKLTKDAASPFEINVQSVGLMRPLLEQEFNRKYPRLAVDRKWTKQDEAIVCLLTNPTFDNEQVAEVVPTTLKQVARFSRFNYLPRFLKSGT